MAYPIYQKTTTNGFFTKVNFMIKENVAILGASNHSDRYSHRALVQLLEHGHNPLLFNPRLGSIDGFRCYAHLSDIKERIDIIAIMQEGIPFYYY